MSNIPYLIYLTIVIHIILSHIFNVFILPFIFLQNILHKMNCFSDEDSTSFGPSYNSTCDYQ